MNEKPKLTITITRQGIGFNLSLEFDSTNSESIERVTQLAQEMFNKQNKQLPDNNDWYGDAYCVKCKVARYFKGKILVSDSGRRMAQGVCSECGTKLNRILGKW